MLDGPINIARSFVIEPLSTHPIQTCSIVLANFIRSLFPSNLPRWAKPLVQAKIEAIGLVDGIVIVFASSEDKVGLAVGITDKLIDKYDAVKFAKLGSETIGGKGGGGRKDFAQAGGQDKSKIDEAIKKIKSLI